MENVETYLETFLDFSEFRPDSGNPFRKNIPSAASEAILRRLLFSLGNILRYLECSSADQKSSFGVLHFSFFYACINHNALADLHPSYSLTIYI